MSDDQADRDVVNGPMKSCIGTDAVAHTLNTRVVGASGTKMLPPRPSGCRHTFAVLYLRWASVFLT